jgi:hypothetical protein
MELRLTLRISLAVFIVGLAALYFWQGLEAMAWFGLGGILTLMNLFLVAWSLRFGLNNLRKSSLLMALLLVKTMSFLGVTAIVLVFLKPLLLPFTLGITIVIVGSILAALWESRRYMKRTQEAGSLGNEG